MLVYAGIDEAGYGPMFGPLCVASAILVLEDYAPKDGEPDLWKMLSHTICRNRKDAKFKIAVNDSKQLKSNAKHKSLTHLERGVLAFMSDSHQEIPTNDDSFFERISCMVNSAPWYQSGTTLPVGNDMNLMRIDAARLRRALQDARIHCPWLACTAIDVDTYNTRTKHATKSALNFSIAMQHVDRIMQTFGEQHPRIMIDRQGGRMRHRNDLQLFWPDANIQILVENKEMSRYRLKDGNSKATISFASKSDEKHMPVAIASMVAKYTRELHMIRFNRYFARECPQLKPTAGYVQDGRRFLKEIEPFLEENAVNQALLVRSS